MVEALYLQAVENRKRREHIQRNIIEVNAAIARVSGKGERVILHAADSEYTANIQAGLLWKALQEWVEDARMRVLELDQEFTKL